MNIALDLDGTLISCAERQITVLKSILNTHNLSVDLESVWQAKRSGLSTEQSLVLHCVDQKISPVISQQWSKIIEEPIWLSLDTVFPCVLHTIDSMRLESAKIWLITARTRSEWLKQQLLRLRLLSRIDQVHCVSPKNVVNAKSQILSNFSASVFIGDSETDFYAAKQAGIPFYAVTCGQRSKEYLSALGIIQNFQNLEAAWSSYTSRS